MVANGLTNESGFVNPEGRNRYSLYNMLLMFKATLCLKGKREGGAVYWVVGPEKILSGLINLVDYYKIPQKKEGSIPTMGHPRSYSTRGFINHVLSSKAKESNREMSVPFFRVPFLRLFLLKTKWTPFVFRVPQFKPQPSKRKDFANSPSSDTKTLPFAGASPVFWRSLLSAGLQEQPLVATAYRFERF